MERRIGATGNPGRRWITVVALAGIAIACAGESPDDAPQVTRQDSAGVEIVRNEAPLWNAGEGWRLESEPFLELGADPDEEGGTLSRVSDVARLEEGLWAIADLGIGRIHFFGPDGTLVASSTGEGPFPSPYQRIAGVEPLPGDSLLVLDGRLPRVTVMGADGDPSRTVDLEPPPSNPGDVLEGRTLARALAVGRFDDGSMLTRGIQHLAPGGLEAGVNRSTRIYLSYGPDGSYREFLAAYPGSSGWVDRSTGPINVLPLLFAPQPRHGVAGDRWFFGSGERYEIAVHAKDGTLIRLVRRHHEPAEVTEDDVVARIERRLVSVTDSAARRRRRGILREMPVPETFPAYDDLVVARDGHLWVEGYRKPGETRPPWSVFAPDGRWLGDVSLPEGFDPMWIDDEVVAGVWVDELDVEHVRAYRIVKP